MVHSGSDAYTCTLTPSHPPPPPKHTRPSEYTLTPHTSIPTHPLSTHVQVNIPSHSTPLRRVPMLGGRELDLFHLFHKVQSFGGSKVVSERRLWGEVARSFGLPSSVTSASYAVRQHYIKCVVCDDEISVKIFIHIFCRIVEYWRSLNCILLTL